MVVVVVGGGNQLWYRGSRNEFLVLGGRARVGGRGMLWCMGGLSGSKEWILVFSFNFEFGWNGVEKE